MFWLSVVVASTEATPTTHETCNLKTEIPYHHRYFIIMAIIIITLWLPIGHPLCACLTSHALFTITIVLLANNKTKSLKNNNDNNNNNDLQRLCWWENSIPPIFL